MAHLDRHHRPEITPPPLSGLPDRRCDWPTAARDAYRHLLGDLNSWCRDHGRSFAGNEWVAEEGVREAWRSPQVAVAS